LRQTRHYCHEVRTLTYVTLDEANGGIIRNLNCKGLGIQAAIPLRPQQRVRLHLELRFPRLRVAALGQVSWATSSGQCGIRFLDLPAFTSHKIDQWIFSNLLDEVAHQDARRRSVLGISPDTRLEEEDAFHEHPRSTFPSPPETSPDRRFFRENIPVVPQWNSQSKNGIAERARQYHAQLNWLFLAQSGRILAWVVDGLAMFAALLLFALVFLCIAREVPPLALALGTASMAAVFVASAYWAMFAVLGGPSPGARLAQAAMGTGADEDDNSS
jgi:PilZ domain